MRDHKLVLSAGVPRQIVQLGDFFHIQAATGPVRLRFDNDVDIEREKTQGGSVGRFTSVIVESATSQAVTLTLGSGFVIDNRLELSGQTIDVETTVPDVLRTPPDVNVSALAAVLVSPGNPNKKSFIVGVPSDSDFSIRLGGDGVAADRGLLVEPGSSVEWATSAAVYAIALGGDVVVSITEKVNS